MFGNQSSQINKISSNQGFTLVEVLIGVTVFSIGILAVGTMQISSIKGNSTARGITEAGTWAADQAERLVALPYDDPDLEDTTTPHTVPHQGKYEISWDVTDDDPIVNTKKITVDVKWKDRGVEKTVAFDYHKAVIF